MMLSMFSWVWILNVFFREGPVQLICPLGDDDDEGKGEIVAAVVEVLVLCIFWADFLSFPGFLCPT